MSAALLVVVVGVVIWAVGLQQDLDDANAQVETQTEQAEAQQEQVEAQQEKVADEAEDLSAEIDELAAAVTTTTERLDQLIADGESSAEEIRTKAGGAADSADAARHRAADTQTDAREAIDALDTRLTELAAAIKAKLADVEGRGRRRARERPRARRDGGARRPRATPEPTEKAEPEHRLRTRGNAGRGRQVKPGSRRGAAAARA